MTVQPQDEAPPGPGADRRSVAHDRRAPADDHRAARAVAAAALLLSSAGLVWLSLVVPGYIRPDWTAVFALTGVAFLVCGLVLLRLQRINGLGVAAVVLLGDAGIVMSAFASVDRSGTTAGALLSVPTLYTATFLRPRWLSVQLVVATAGAWVINVLVPASGPVHLVRTSVLVVASTCPAVIVVILRRQLDRAVVTDPLTGLLNRRGLEMRFPPVVARARRCDLPVAVLLIDVDHFKRVNDQLGHLAGDEALRRIATATADCAGASALVVRLGGEELVVIVAADATRATDLAERVRGAVEDDETAPHLTVSIGCTWATPGRDGTTSDWALLDRLLGRSDDLMYEAKRSGRNRVVAQA